MNIKNNTILITGGNTGIGRALAEKFSARGNKVIITGRRQDKIDETLEANPEMTGYVLDIQIEDDIYLFASTMMKNHPELNVLINNAGVGGMENLLEGTVNLGTAETAIITNVLGPIRLTMALLPQLLGQPGATVVTLGSGLAHVPLAVMPTYSASKAAIHSWTQSLRHQLKDKSVEVIEIIPPAVHTGFLGSDEPAPHEMPLDDFISEVMQQFDTQPVPSEICVKNVIPLRNAEASDKYQEMFDAINSMI